MPQLTVRHLEEDIDQALKERAGRHGRSAEAEHREILRAALAKPPAEDPKAVLLDMPNVGTDEDFEPITTPGYEHRVGASQGQDI